MAPRQTTPTTAPADPTTSLGAPPGPTGAQQNVASPIGVPYYEIDPATGQPKKNAAGQDTRWTAHPAVPNDVNAINQQGGLVHAGGMVQSVPPRYFDGDQWLPGSLSPQDMTTLQKAMVAAGMAKPGQLQIGVWDTASMSVYSQLLAYANSSGTDWKTALDQWGAAHTANPETGATHVPLTVKVTNPDDLRSVFRAAIINTLGQGWDSAKIDQMVNAYQGVETQAQYQQYAQQGSGSSDPSAGTGGTVVAPPTPQAFAEQQAKTENPDLAQEHDTLGYISQFHQMLAGWK